MTTDDEIMLTDLARVLAAIDGEHSSSTAAAKAAFAWRSLDFELAELTFDSRVDEPEVVVRSGATDLRRLSFTSGSVSIEIETGSEGTLIGQVIPPGPALVRMIVSTDETVATSAADDMGVFTFADLPASPISLESVALDGSWSVRTSWIIA